VIKNYILLLFYLCVSVVFSRQERDSLIIPVDKNQKLNQRSFEGDLNDKYSGSDYEYSSQEGEAQNLITRFLNWFSNWINNTFGINLPPNTLEVLKWLIYVLMGALVLYLVIRFISGEKLSAIFTKKATAILDINLSEDHIENIDLDALIKSALAEKDYRLAVRYQFLRTLKLLSQKGLIAWNFEKTNSDYQNEIKEQKLKSGFNDVSYLYDYIWYGEQNIDHQRYDAVEAKFTDLKRLLTA